MFSMFLSMFFSLVLSAYATPPAETGIALRQGNCSKAIASYPTPQEPQYKLAIARCHIALGDLPIAEQMLDSIQGPLQPYATMYQAESAILRQDALLAKNLAKEVEKIPDLKNRSLLIQAKAEMQSKHYLEARDILRVLLTPQISVDGYVVNPNEIDPAEIRWLLAEGARLRGATDSAIPVYWKIWTSNPTSNYARLAEEKLISLGQRIPDATTQAGREKIAQRAKTFRKLQLHKEALACLDLLPVPESQDEIRNMAHYIFNAKDYARAVGMFEKLTPATDEDIFHLAVVSIRSGNYDGAIAYYKRLLQDFPKSSKADIASYKIAYSEYDRGNYSTAIPLFKDHLQRMPSSKYADESVYWIAWSHTKLHQYTEAKEYFVLMQKKYFSSSLAPGAAFWYAWILKEEGDQAQAEKSFQYLLRTWPTSGYAWQASKYVPVHFPAHVPLVLPDLPASLQNPTYTLGMELAEVGFEKEAQQMLLGLKSSVTGDKTAELLLAHALIKAGAYTDAKNIAKKYCTQSWKGGEQLAMEACYPKPHQEIISSTIGKHPLHPYLPYAIMTAESGLQPEVSSPAGARGMMQLMPDLAGTLHASVYMNQPYNPDLLFQSGYNVTLGTTELMHLYSSMSDLKIEDHLPLAIAGYNGGETAVRRWMALYAEEPSVAEFSDDIGYTETRQYNRRVLGYLMEYMYVYGVE